MTGLALSLGVREAVAQQRGIVTEAQRQASMTALARYCPVRPHPKQAEFLACTDSEILYGGAAGGAKTYALAMAALQWVDIPGYSALLLRRTFTELEQDNGLMPLLRSWLEPSDARWTSRTHTWTFPSGASIRFGYLEHDNDVWQYRGPSYQQIIFDELTTFTAAQYRAMFHPLRKPAAGPVAQVPLQRRNASNPGGPYEEWVDQRWGISDAETCEPGCTYIPSRLSDNPSIDPEVYIGQSLSHMTAAEQARLIDGVWGVAEKGELFDPDWIAVTRRDAGTVVAAVRAWDLAATRPTPANPDPDYTVGALYERHSDGRFHIRHVHRFRDTSGEVEKAIFAAAENDTFGTLIRLPRDPGQAGVDQADQYAAALAAYPIKAVPVSGSKVVRARPFASAAENQLVTMEPGAWNRDLRNELQRFPRGHDDQVDALSLAHATIALRLRRRARSSIPQGDLPRIGAGVR